MRNKKRKTAFYGEEIKVIKVLQRLERKYAKLPEKARVPQARIMKKYIAMRKRLDILLGKDKHNELFNHSV